MQYDREDILNQLVAAQEVADDADARLYAAEALADVVSHPGLRYAPVAVDDMVYVVACNGRPIGQLWRGEGGHLFGGWTAAPFGAEERLGPFNTGRAAAAAVARACGVSPVS